MRLPFMIVRSVALLRPSERVNPIYVLKWIQNTYVQKIIKRMIHDTARGGLYLNKIKKIPILTPSLPEQITFVEWYESMESNLEMLSKLVTQLVDQISILKNTILFTAFKGKLVPQDRNDEPAEVLLQKIKQERELQIKNTKRKSQ